MVIEDSAVALEIWESDWHCGFMLTTNEIYNDAILDEIINIDLYHGQEMIRTDIPVEKPVFT